MFQPGDVVALKSGGPDMTVTTVESGVVICMWFDKDGKRQSMNFKAVALEKIEH